jgi:hypothetical protein
MTVNIDQKTLAHVLDGEVSGSQVLAPGPGHSRADRSLCVKLSGDAPDGFLVHSFAGDDPLACKDYVRERLGQARPKPNGSSQPRVVSENAAAKALRAAIASSTATPPPKATIVATYDYMNADGVLLQQVCRYEPKGFRQRRPDGNGGWIWDTGEHRVPYRLPELLKYPEATVFICEGEKDADRVAALGYCATTVAAGKWTDECVQALAGRDLIILQDNDRRRREEGIRGGSTIARGCKYSSRCFAARPAGARRCLGLA